MTDKELADLVWLTFEPNVVIRDDYDDGERRYSLLHLSHAIASEVVNDWRIAGALMEKHANRHGYISVDFTMLADEPMSRNLCREIVEGCANNLYFESDPVLDRRADD